MEETTFQHGRKSDRNRPRLANFSGASEKDSTPYDVWRYEVRCLQQDSLYSEEMITKAMRRSLKGDAAKVLVRLGSHAAVTEVLQKLDGLYATEGALLTQFYAAQQKDNEDVTAWSCRLEDIIQGVYDQKLIS